MRDLSKQTFKGHIMTEERRSPKNKNNRKLFWENIARANLQRCFVCSISLAISLSIILILVNTIFLNDQLVHFVLPGAFFAVGCGAFSFLTYRTLALDARGYFDMESYCFVGFSFLYLSYLSILAIRYYNSFALYCIAVMIGAYVIYTTTTQYIIISGIEFIDLAVIIVITGKSGIVIEFSQVIMIAAAHVFGFILSRDNYNMRTEITRQEFRAKKETKQAERDPLTGLINRRGLEREIAPIWKVCVRQEDLVGVIIIDIDHFKKYNDGFGHVQGDVCLKQVSARIATTVGETGFTSRIGGEEFLVFMYGMTEDEMYNMAERIRTDVEDLRIQHATAKNAVVTISLGLDIETAASDLNFTILYGRADKLLYKAKQIGRNRVICNRKHQLTPPVHND